MSVRDKLMNVKTQIETEVAEGNHENIPRLFRLLDVLIEYVPEDMPSKKTNMELMNDEN